MPAPSVAYLLYLVLGGCSWTQLRSPLAVVAEGCTISHKNIDLHFMDNVLCNISNLLAHNQGLLKSLVK